MSEGRDSRRAYKVNSEPNSAMSKKVDRIAAGNRRHGCISSDHFLTTMTAIATVAAILIGYSIKLASADHKWTPRELMYIQFTGDLFLRLLKLLIIPLITTSIISAVGSLDLGLSKKIGLQSILYYVLTTTLAVFQGILWVLVIRPGKGFSSTVSKNVTARSEPEDSPRTTDTLMDLIRNLFPQNIIEAAIFQEQSVLEPPKNSSGLDPNDLFNWEVKQTTTRNMNVLGLVMFSVALGITIAKLGKPGEPLLRLIDSLLAATMMLTKAVIWLSPVGVFFLVVANVISMESLSSMLAELGMYFITVLWGLLVHGFIVVPLIYVICLRKSPVKFIMNMGPAITTAFGTASSSASLPVSMHCLEERNHIDVRVSRFVLPIGATINMDGTALYEAVAAIFIAQHEGLVLSFVDVLAISITATMASIGAAGIPQAGLVTMVMVLSIVNLPADKIALILAVDWFLDRCRTTVNVLGDAVGAGIVAELSRDELERMDEETAKPNEYPMYSAPNATVADDTWNNSPVAPV